MPFTKTFGTTAGAYSTETLWEKISVRTAAFAWTLSGLGTTEYYVRTAALGNPGFIATPPTSNGVYINGSAATKATLGSLAAGNWGFGDNDTLGYSTLYVRLSGGGDPDAQVDGHVQFQQMPQATEHVRFASTSASINSATGLDQSAVAIGDFIVEKGYAGTIGTAALGYLIIDPDRFEFNSANEAWINLHTAAIAPQIIGTSSPNTGNRGLYLRGSAMTVVNIRGGSVGIAVRPGETSTATTVRVLPGASVWLGNGLTLTNLHTLGGDDTRVRGAVTTTIMNAGTIITEENGAMTTVTQKGGLYIYNSTGTITTFNHRGGSLDEMQSGAARTITAYNPYQGAQILRNLESVTHTAETLQDSSSIGYGSF